MPAKEIKPIRKRAYHSTEKTKKVIFDRAMALMSEKGFQGTTVREICAQAGISIGTFYNCYKSKMDILKPVYEQGDSYFDSVRAELEGKDAVAQLHLFGECYARLNVDTGIEVMRVLFYPMNEWFAQTRPMQELLLELVSAGQGRGELKTDRDAEHIVRYIFDVLRGVCYNWCVYDGAFDITARIDEHISLLCSALKA